MSGDEYKKIEETEWNTDGEIFSKSESVWQLKSLTDEHKCLLF